MLVLFLDEHEVREWSPDHDAWLALAPSDVLHDPVFDRPIPIRTLVDPTEEELEEAEQTAWRKAVDRRYAEELAERARWAEIERWIRRWCDACIGVVDELCAHLGISLDDCVRKKEELDAKDLMRLYADLLNHEQIPVWMTFRPWEETCEQE